MQKSKAKMQNYKSKSSKVRRTGSHIFVLSFLIFIFTFSFFSILPAFAQNDNQAIVAATADSSGLNPISSSFKIVVCDGPAGANTSKDQKYVPCDFNGLMLQVQHLINIMMVFGVFASIAAFSWAGALYISGKPSNKERAHSVFPKIFTGFIMMLSAWFIVYQILSWLTNNDGFKTLLGNP